MVSATTFGRYELGPRIATGGMGEVFLATQTGMGAFAKPLVLKLMLPHLAQHERAIEMFLAEARLASRMNHPNVVQIFDVGVIDGRYFIAMELVRGVSLSKLVSGLQKSGEALSIDQLLYVARCLCDALHHAHEQRGADGKPLNLIHQDVTLENILVGTEGQVKLTDFGIARAARGSTSSSVAGKQGYIAPERFEGVELDRRADVYSAAITLLSLAALERPHERGGSPLPSMTKTALPAELVRTLEQAASTGPRARFDTARKLRDALPPMSSTTAAEDLGALVQRLCLDQVTQLDGDVQRTTRFTGAGTGVLATKPVPSGQGRRGASIALGAGLLVALTGFVLLRASPSVEVQPAVVDAGLAVVTQTPDSGEREDAGEKTLTTTVPVEPIPVPPSVVDAGVSVAVSTRVRPGKKQPPPSPVTNSSGTGVLTIDATPWAMVSINGKAIGETPIGRYTVNAGTVVIDFVNPETGAKGRRTVVVKAGTTLAINETLR